MILTQQNGNLTQELENILKRDEKIILYKLNKNKYLRNIQNENNNKINSSLNILKNHIIKYGNMGKKYANKNIEVNNDTINNTYNNSYISSEKESINFNTLQNSKQILNLQNNYNTINQKENIINTENKEDK